MATINYYLDKPNAKNLRLILMTYQNKGLKFRHSTQIKILEKTWDFNTQRIKRNVSGEIEINSYLKKLIEVINKIEREALLENKTLTLKAVQYRFGEELNKKTDRRSFYDYYQEYIDSSRGLKAYTTIQGYKKIMNHIKKFSDAFRIEIDFEMIDRSFYDGYLDYLMNDCKFLNNTVGSHIKTIKSFMNYATEKGYNKRNMAYKSFKTIREDVDIVYLTEEELFKILEVEGLTNVQAQVRDNFCFGCFTGLRYSDTAKLSQENIKDDHIEFVTQKTKDFLRIPLNQYAMAILNKYSGKLPPSLTNQKTNDNLKVIAELAKVNQKVKRIKNNGVNKIELNEPKYNFITSHTARRTFVTLSLEKGMRPETVMAITGHKDYATFKKYIKLTDKVKMIEMNKVWNNRIKSA